MRRAFIILPEAEREITEVMDWYHARNPQAGAAFRREVRLRLATIRGHPLRFPTVYRDGRAVFLSRFPYQVTYTADEEEIIVVACTHQSRDPAVWMKRLR